MIKPGSKNDCERLLMGNMLPLIWLSLCMDDLGIRHHQRHHHQHLQHNNNLDHKVVWGVDPGKHHHQRHHHQHHQHNNHLDH